MFSFFKKRPKNKTLIFKSNDAAFEYAATYLQRPLIIEGTLFAQVIAETKPNEMFTIRISTDIGIITTHFCGTVADSISQKIGEKPIPIKAGDLVAVQVASYSNNFAPTSPAQYFLILMTLKPEIDPKTHLFIPIS